MADASHPPVLKRFAQHFNKVSLHKRNELMLELSISNSPWQIHSIAVHWTLTYLIKAEVLWHGTDKVLCGHNNLTILPFPT